ncbi:MAG: substrate-binding periplasmic protein [Cellvibrionaceae bacterium]
MPRLLHTLCLILALGIANLSVYASDKDIAPSSLTVKIPKQTAGNIGHNSYVIEILRMALERSKSADETIKITQLTESLSQARQIAELQRGNELDLIWTMTSVDREAVIKPVRIPLLKGLLGKRVFLVRSDRAADFSGITQLQQLRGLMAGQGSHWPDTLVLRHNGLSVVTTTNYPLLFDMLAGRRFDYFPRGANEAWQELSAHPKKPLQVEPTILLSYVAPMYFFVSPGNQALADRLENGLNSLYQDGSFDRHFYQHPSIRAMLSHIDINNRRTFKLDNPLLPKGTPTDVSHYWIKLDQATEHSNEP